MREPFAKLLNRVQRPVLLLQVDTAESVLIGLKRGVVQKLGEGSAQGF